MADYAKKGKPNAPGKGRPKGKGKGKPEPKNNGPRVWFMLVMAVVLLSGFFYFLFYIDGKAEDAPVEVEVIGKPVKAVKKPTAELPKVPAKKWQYIDQLKDKEVIVDVPDQPTSSHQYRLQCASYRSQNQADSLKAKIAFQGYASHIKQVKGNSSDWYQVYLGPFKTRRLAEAARHRMQRARINGCQIYYWEG